MAYKRRRHVFIKLFIVTSFLRWFCTANLPADVSNIPKGSNEFRRNTNQKKLLDHKTGAKEEEYHLSATSVSVKNLTSRLQINIRDCSKHKTSSCLSVKKEKNLLNQSYTSETREKNNKLNVKRFDHALPLDKPKKSLTTLCNHFDADDKSSLLSQWTLPNKTSETVFQEKPSCTTAHKTRLKRFSNQVTHSFTKVKTTFDFDENMDSKLSTLFESKNTSDFNGTEEGTSMEKTLNPNQGIATTIYDIDDDEFLTFTCEGRCGQRMSYPCSCSATCVIYDNCCDNMIQDCPHLLDESQARFEQMKTADIICNKYFIYTVVSCPKLGGQQGSIDKINLLNTSEKMLEMKRGSFGNNNFFLSSVSTPSNTEHIIGVNTTTSTATMKTEKDSILQRLTAALSDAPVTDADTGITFINRAVYDCHNMPDSTALSWSLRLNFTFVTPTKLEDFDSGQEFNEYKPDFNKEVFKSHLCGQDIKDKCGRSANLKDLVNVYAEKCQKSNAKVFLSRYQKTIYYRNKFCAFCNGRSPTELQLSFANQVVFRTPILQILMSLSKSKMFTFKATNAEFVSGSMVPLPWSYANCSVQNENSIKVPSDPEAAESESRVLCSAICHHPMFTVRSNGICKAPHEALLAIADDGLAPLCPVAMTGLANFVVCGLKNEVASLRNADISSETVSIMFDSSLNRSLYVVKIQLALYKRSDDIFSSSHESNVQNIFHAALLAKSFKNYRIMQKLCSQKKEEAKMKAIKAIRSSSIENYIESRTLLNFSHAMEKLRGRRVEGENKTTVCLTPVDGVNKADPNLLYCLEDAVYERDSELINKFSDSPCFSYLDNLESLGSNRVTKTMGSYWGLLQWTLFLDVLVTGIFITT